MNAEEEAKLTRLVEDRLASHAMGRDKNEPCDCNLCDIARAYQEAIKGRDHTRYWYAVRLEVIKDVAKRVGVWDEVAAIIANGSGTRMRPDGSVVYDPPTYAQQLNVAFHRAEAAEGALRKYGAHPSHCDLEAFPISAYPDAKPACTCGLAEIIKRMGPKP